MPIIIADIPSAAGQLVGKNIVERNLRSSFGLRRLAATTPEVLTVAFPHRIAHLPLAAIRPYSDLRRVAVDAGWRFLVQVRRPNAGSSERPDAKSEEFVSIAAASIVETGANSFDIGDFNEGPFVEGTDKAVREAEKIEAVRKGRYEAVLLVVPAINVTALWLQSIGHAADILIPIPPVDPLFQAGRPISSHEFLRIAHRLALRVRSGHRAATHP